MKKIQVDSFEVQLGAGMLIQFRDGGNKPITVLADAGVHAPGYDDDHVLRKLPDALDAFSQGHRRIDLIVGTHYDADHLRGLPPIIRDSSIEIGEIWLPPVADDEAPNPMGASLWENQYLALKWHGEDGERLAKDYLAAQWEQCEALRSLEREALRLSGEADGLSWKAELMRRREVMLAEKPKEAFEQKKDFASLRQAFRDHLEECSDLPGDEGCDCHANTEIGLDDSSDVLPDFASYRGKLLRFDVLRKEGRERLFEGDPSRAAQSSLSLAQLRKATASNAITASHLAEVVKAISERGNIAVKCRVIPDGTPVKFKWSGRSRKFLPGAAAKEHEPVITLLGPSEALVKKHRDKLPFIETANVAFFSAIPIKAITPSNQLSYIFRIDHEGQGVLVTGDAGCVDYKPKSGGSYYPALVSQFSSLQVVQVAHHAGNNAHFYRVLLEESVSYPEDGTFLILSHATEDKYRPSEAFGQFVGSLAERVRPSLLFTSRPHPQRVEGFEGLIHQVVGRKEDQGDIRLSFDGQGWQVDSHAIQV
jgi:hypothetical protein